VDLLQNRQTALLRRTPTPRLTVVLDESALARPVGADDVTTGQEKHLRNLADQMHIDIRYLPWRAGARPILRGGSFRILDFADAEDPAVVYIETLTGARYLERPDELDEYRRVLGLAYAQSVPISDHRR
jgi:hypothetical protein